uniref:Uncharacterized protein n=1 Tax=Pipistrellus kuhlii TaxID=59472 RepID=A0A7J7S608_PIPKU|nr:hypothetical protein mPipKuh1_010036 [Pipistrellus kuhlii]
MLTKGDQNTGYQRLWFIFRGNLSSQEHQADSMPLGLILLENCQVEPCFGATEPYAFTILTPGVEGTEVGQSKLEAENQELGTWLWVQAGVSWRQLAVLLPPQYQSCAKQLAKNPADSHIPLPPQDCGLLATLSPHSRFQELHERFGKEIRALQVIRRGLQEDSTNGGSRSQAKMEQELNRCLLMND